MGLPATLIPSDLFIISLPYRPLSPSFSLLPPPSKGAQENHPPLGGLMDTPLRRMVPSSSSSSASSSSSFSSLSSSFSSSSSSSSPPQSVGEGKEGCRRGCRQRASDDGASTPLREC